MTQKISGEKMDQQTFWQIRSAHYDKLYWTKDKYYLESIIKASRLKKKDIVLDVGTGTGIVARAIKSHVKHVVALDVSASMLEKGKWDDFSVVKWDIADLLFANNTFNKVIARMVFHHILHNLDRAVLRCFDLLKDKGLLVVAEGVPPSDDQEVIDWYSHMFSFKEKRRTFTGRQLKDLLIHNGFKNTQLFTYTMKRFSVGNWLSNSGLDKGTQNMIFKMHIKASPKVKKAYNMKMNRSDCLVDTKNVIVVGQKNDKK